MWTTFENREAWLEGRRHYLGGSDAACVVGLNPWKTNVQLWEEKTGRAKAPDISDSPSVKYGTQAEPYLRQLFKLDFPEYEVFYEENNSFKNERYPFAAASLDGWLRDADGRLGVLEIKTSTLTGAASWAKWNDKIPDNYFCQVLFYMAVIEADFAVLTAQLKTQKQILTRRYFFERQEVQEDMEYLMEQARLFWQYVERDERPPLVLPQI